MDKSKAIADLLKFAENQLGYKEKKSKKDLNSKTANAGSNNYTKYAQFFDDLRKEGTDVYNGPKNPAPWCDLFVDYCFYQVFNGDTGLKMLYQPTRNSCGAGCKFSAEYFRKNKAIYNAPAVGDVVYFGPVGNEQHTGIVYKLNAKSYVTIEGNKNNEVKKVTHKLTEAAQFGRPNWAIASEPETPAEKPAQEKPAAKPEPMPAPKPQPIASNKKTITAETKPEKYKKEYAKTWTINTEKDPLRLRKGPGTNYGILTRMPKGAKVTCNGEYTGVWLFVTYEANAIIYRGYCSINYLK